MFGNVSASFPSLCHAPASDLFSTRPCFRWAKPGSKPYLSRPYLGTRASLESASSIIKLCEWVCWAWSGSKRQCKAGWVALAWAAAIYVGMCVARHALKTEQQGRGTGAVGCIGHNTRVELECQPGERTRGLLVGCLKTLEKSSQFGAGTVVAAVVDGTMKKRRGGRRVLEPLSRARSRERWHGLLALRQRRWRASVCLLRGAT